MSYVIIAVSLIIAILISSTLTKMLGEAVPALGRLSLLVFDVVVFVALYTGGLKLSEFLDLENNFDKQSHSLSASLVTRNNSKIIGSETVSQTPSEIVIKMYAKTTSDNLITYICTNTKVDNGKMISAQCKQSQ